MKETEQTEDPMLLSVHVAHDDDDDVMMMTKSNCSHSVDY